MPFSNPAADAIAGLLRAAKTVAVVGLSDNPQRPSYEVASYLLDAGYRIIPVNPALAVWEGIRAVPSLADAQAMLLSLIYNRGTSLDKKEDRRREMVAIKPLVKKGVAALADIAEQVESMVRLWPKSKGLRDRRKREAKVIRGADRTYDPSELVRL